MPHKNTIQTEVLSNEKLSPPAVNSGGKQSNAHF
jgi:hypothetical protein